MKEEGRDGVRGGRKKGGTGQGRAGRGASPRGVGGRLGGRWSVVGVVSLFGSVIMSTIYLGHLQIYP